MLRMSLYMARPSYSRGMSLYIARFNHVRDVPVKARPSLAGGCLYKCPGSVILRDDSTWPGPIMLGISLFIDKFSHARRCLFTMPGSVMLGLSLYMAVTSHARECLCKWPGPVMLEDISLHCQLQSC